MLKCNVKGVENGYPLKIDAEKVEILPSDYDAGSSVTSPITTEDSSFMLSFLPILTAVYDGCFLSGS